MENTSQQQQDQQVPQEDENFSLEQAADISPEEEQKLMAFLMKASQACSDDNSVPDFVGSQVNEWLKELQQKKEGDDDKQ